jgi:Ca2+-binding EF-hand superfamily protein
MRQHILTACAALALIGAAPVAMAQAPNRDKAQQNLKAADANGDGALTRDEFGVLIDLNADAGIGRAAAIKRAGRQDQAFGRIDRNGDGVATKDEIGAMRDVAAE